MVRNRNTSGIPRSGVQPFRPIASEATITNMNARIVASFFSIVLPLCVWCEQGHFYGHSEGVIAFVVRPCSRDNSVVFCRCLSSYRRVALFLEGWVLSAWVGVWCKTEWCLLYLSVCGAVGLLDNFTIRAWVFASPFAPEFDGLEGVRFELRSAAAPFPNHSSSQTL